MQNALKGGYINTQTSAEIFIFLHVFLSEETAQKSHGY
jgi:hypothetical protein